MTGHHDVPRTLAFIVALHLSCALVGWAWLASRIRRGLPLLAPQPFPDCPWGLPSFLCVVVTWFAVSQLVVLTLHAVITAGLPPESFTRSAEPAQWFLLEQLLSLACLNAIMIVLIPEILEWTSGARLEQLGLSLKGARRCALIGAGAHFLITPAIYAVYALALRIWPEHKHPVEQMLRSESSGSAVAIVALSAVVVGPWFEEILFRGVLLGWLRKVFALKPIPPEPSASAGELDLQRELAPELLQRPRPKALAMLRSHPLLAAVAPNLITSLCFAALHWGQWPAPAPLFLLSLVLGYLYLRTGTLVASVTLHALLNLSSTSALLFGLT
jgi:membrane protease YdiL (CAAX protease family)